MDLQSRPTLLLVGVAGLCLLIHGPAFSRKRVEGRWSVIRSEMSAIEDAKVQWAIDHKARPDAKIDLVDLERDGYLEQKVSLTDFSTGGTVESRATYAGKSATWWVERCGVANSPGCPL